MCIVNTVTCVVCKIPSDFAPMLLLSVHVYFANNTALHLKALLSIIQERYQGIIEVRMSQGDVLVHFIRSETFDVSFKCDAESVCAALM